MPGQSKTVIICGAGLAGLALGALLRDQGFHVLVVEKRPLFERQGYTFTMQAPGWRALDELGLRASVAAAGYRLPFVLVQAASGKELRRVDGDLAEAITGGPVIQLFRWQVIEALLERARDRGCKIVTGSSIKSVQVQGERVQVHLDGEEEPRTADLLIGADGTHSQVRAQLRLGAATVDPIWSLSLMGPSRGEGFRLRLGTEAYMVIAPMGQAESHWVLTSRRTLPEPCDDLGLREALRQGLREVGEHMNIAETATRLRWIRNEEVNLGRWSAQGRVVLVGDAAHAVWHTAGLGGSLALADATTLARFLARHPIPEAIAAFEAERRPIAERVRRLARKNMRLNLPPEWLAGVRNLMLRFLPLSLLAPPSADVDSSVSSAG